MNIGCHSSTGMTMTDFIQPEVVYNLQTSRVNTTVNDDVTFHPEVSQHPSHGDRHSFAEGGMKLRPSALDEPRYLREPQSGPKRTRKHPATFQCSLCSKRFTRAYNMRSHLRTHTDERPFTCTICGKEFIRRHDCKRHERLHSSERKFVCKGSLAAGEQWGCGRRFARADALSRHFKSNAGRLCIGPLLEEEMVEHQGWYSRTVQQSVTATGLVSGVNASTDCVNWANGNDVDPTTHVFWLHLYAGL